MSGRDVYVSDTYGLFHLRADVVTSIDDPPDQGQLLPQSFELGQNYPNPFNPSTTIEFGMTEHSHATLTIYNVLGETVITLIDRSLAPGTHKVTWDGQDDDGQSVATGIYLYKLSLGDGREQTRKMVLLK